MTMGDSEDEALDDLDHTAVNNFNKKKNDSDEDMFDM